MLKMLNLLKHVFYCRNTRFFEGPAVRKINETCKTHAQNRCLKSVLKIHGILSKTGPRKGFPKRPKAYFFRCNFTFDFQHVFDVLFGSNFCQKWVQKGIQNVIKNGGKSSPAPGCNFGVIWGGFWIDFGSIWG